jgi:succinate dehydrogenase / fumarate reductase flavoprotein subunit
MWDYVGMGRNAAGLEKAIKDIAALRDEFWKDVKIPGQANELNPELEKAGRVADFLELGELMARDALQRNESCGGHFREEYQTPEGEALRNDAEFMFTGAWKFTGLETPPEMIKEKLEYEFVEVKQRNYK